MRSNDDQPEFCLILFRKTLLIHVVRAAHHDINYEFWFSESQFTNLSMSNISGVSGTPTFSTNSNNETAELLESVYLS